MFSREADARTEPHGTDGIGETCTTLSPEEKVVPTPKTTHASGAKPVTASASTRGRNSPLNDVERMRFLRIKRERREGWMVTLDDVDFLLEMAERRSR